MARLNRGFGRHGLWVGLVACSALTGTAQAQQWRGGTSSDWFTDANWDVNRAPATNDTVTIDTGQNTPVILDRDIDLTLSGLFIGSNNRAALTIRGGAVVAVSGQSGIGGGQITGTAGDGTLLVSGTGTELRLGAQLYVAPRTNSRGVLTVENGAVVRSNSAVFGTAVGTSATITVDGTGSLIDIGNGALYVGQTGDLVGTRDIQLRVTGGGRLVGGSSVTHVLGEGARLLVSGAGSEMTATTALGITGDARIEAGGTLRYRTFGTDGDARIVIDGGNFIADAVGNSSGLSMGGTSSIVATGGRVDIGSLIGMHDDSVMTLDGSILRAPAIRMLGRSTLNIGAADGAARGRAGEFTTELITLESANSKLVFNHNGRLTLGASLTGSGTILHRAGTTVLTSTAPTGFSGLFDHSGGTVLLNGTLAVGEFRVSGGATFGGTGTIRNGRLTVLDGTLSPGDAGVGTLTLGSLSLGANSILNFDLGAPNQAPGAGSDHINVNTPDGSGALVLDGTLNVTDIGGFGAGLYRLISYKGSLTDNGLAIGTVPEAFRASGMTVQTSIAGQVNLAVADAPGRFNFWDGGGAANDGIVAGGSGTWNASNTNWTDTAGAQNGAYDPAKLLIFAGTGGVVTVDNAAGQVQVIDRNQFAPLGIQFASDGYRLEGGAIDFAGGVATIRVGDGSSTGAAFRATIASSLTGANALDKTDLGTLILTGQSNIAGRPRVQGGTLEVAGGGRLTSIGMEIALLGAPATLRVTGPGSLVDLGVGGIRTGFVNDGAGTIEVLAGGTLRDAIGSGHNFGAGSTVRVSGSGSLLDLDMASASRGALIVENGAVARIAPFAFTSTGNLILRGGGRIETLGGEGNWVVPNALIEGSGTAFNSVRALAMAPATSAQPGAAVIVEDGASVTVNTNTDSALGFEGALSTLDVRSGASFALTGGANAGLQMENARLTVDGASVRIDGALSMGQRFGNTELVLRGSDFTSRSIQGFTGTNIVSIGARSGEAAGAAGGFDVGSFGFSNRGTTLVLNHIQRNYLIRTNFTGDGTIRHLAGDTRFTGSSRFFAGITELSGGHLRIDGEFGGNASRMTVSGGAILSGSGRIGGSVVVGSGTIAPGGEPQGNQEARSAALPSDPVGLLTIDGDLTLAAQSFLRYQLGAVGGVAGVDSDLINVGGGLTLDGTVDVVDAGAFGAGLYRLINYGGALVDNGLDIGMVPTGFTPADLTIQTSVAGQVNLLVQTPVTSFAFWDGGGTGADGVVAGGTGNWSVGAGNWTIANGTRNGAYDPNALLILAGTGGVVTVTNGEAQVAVNQGMQFAVNGYSVTGGALRLDGAETIVRVGDGTSAGSGFVATIAAPVTGTGGLVKTDLGTLVLAGTNSYSGGTFVRAGTIRGNVASLTGGFDIGAAGTLHIEQPENGAFTGTLTGTGSLVKSGAGSLTIAGDLGAFGGSATIEAGTLALTGRLGGRTTIAAGATLIGNGTLGALDIAGRIAPGTGTATMNVTGNVIFRAGSTYAVDLAAAGANDRINAGGTATLEGGTVAVTTLDPETDYRNGSRFRILEAAGGLTGRFAALTEQSAFLDFRLDYDATGASIEVVQVRTFPDVALTFNQRQASGALAVLDREPGSDGLAVYNALLMLDADAARAAFDASSGEIYAVLVGSDQRGSLQIADRLASRGQAALDEGLGVWGGVIGQAGRVDSDGNGGRFTHDRAGGELGLDYRGSGNGWAAGLGGGWQSGDVNLAARSSHATRDMWHIGGYLRSGTGGSGFTALTSLVHARTDARVTRTIAYGGLSRQARADTGVATTAISVDLRYGLGDRAWTVGPDAGLDWSSSRLGSFSETGADALDLTATRNRDVWTRYGIGGFARMADGRGHLDISARYVIGDRNHADVELDMAGSPRRFEVRAAQGARAGADLRATAAYELGGNWTIGGQIGAFVSGDERDVAGNLRLGFRF
ncbi:autotransporter outer membrane beta-barrel domain-containing protein [Sphingomonas sp. CJ99]